jgi:hypothetical protein
MFFPFRRARPAALYNDKAAPVTAGAAFFAPLFPPFFTPFSG